MGGRQRKRAAAKGRQGKPYEGHESLTGYLLFYALRAGITERAFWKMTAHNVIMAFRASEQNMSRLAYRTAIYQRIDHKKFPKTEDAMFAKAKPQRQTLAQQYAMARLITKVMH
jgi:pyruvate kinase